MTGHGGWPRRLGRKLVRILAATAVVLVAVAATGAAWEALERRAFQRTGHDPPGRMVDIGGRQLHLVCSGSGAPGVMLIAGLADMHTTWEPVFDPIAEFSRVCAYDRAGIGWSDPADSPRTARAAADDLAALLAAARPFGDRPPVLVGHSIGGLYAREYARQAPGGVAGLVLLDPTTRELYRAAADWRSDAVFRVLWPALGRLGILRWKFHRAHAHLEPSTLDRLAGVATGYPAARAAAREYSGLADSFGGGPTADPPADVPLLVLSARRERDGEEAKRTGEAEHLSTVRRASHRRLADAGARGRMIEAESGHYIHHDRPDTVVALVRDVVRRARGKGDEPR